jgi:hypothetical protein
MNAFENIFQKQLSHLRHRQEILAILIFSLVTCLVWVSLELMTSQRKTTVSAELMKLAQPLTPTINNQVLNELQQKRHYAEAELSSFPIYRVISAKERALRDRQSTTNADSAQNSTSLGTLTSSFLEPEPASESATQDSVEPAVTDTTVPESTTPTTEDDDSQIDTEQSTPDPTSGEVITTPQ